MNETVLWLAAQVLALLLAYWISDVLFRREAFFKLVKRIGASHRVSSYLLAAAAAALTLFFPWPEEVGHLAIFGSIHASMMAWKSGTDDIDIARGEAWWAERAMLLACGIGAWFSPAWIPLQMHLTSRPFIGWKHHGSLPLRVMQLCFAFAVLALTGWVTDISAFLVALFMMLGSHYVPTAIAKSLLGPRWYSWMLDNKLFYVAASSYRWGWARFLTPKAWTRVLKVFEFLNRPMQIAAWVAEAASPLMLLHPNAALGLCGTIAVFHVAVFISTGIFFWEWTVTNILVIGLVLTTAPEVLDISFGILPWVMSAMLMVALPLRGKLWDPNPLGWWDTPLTQRVSWRVVGESGTVYGLHNDFMCPHERNYGRVHGCFMIDEIVFTYHLGEVWRIDLRDDIRSLRDHPERLSEIRAKYGISVAEPNQAAQHERYLKRFLQQLNRGARKHVFPRWLRWLKAPGGQFYYWGDRPSFKGQEKAVEVQFWYTEEYWDGEVHHQFQEKMLNSFQVEEELVEEPCEECDEKVIDAMVIQRANGRLVFAPEWIVDRSRDLYQPS
ncbi:MAG: hypothetical protein AAF654_03710 [Myxococcota bacterium]